MMGNWVLLVRVEVKSHGIATIVEFQATWPEIVENQKVAERDSVEKAMEVEKDLMGAAKDLGKTRLAEKGMGKEAKQVPKEVVSNVEGPILKQIVQTLVKPEVKGRTA